MAKKLKGPPLADVKAGLAAPVVAHLLGIGVRRFHGAVKDGILPGPIAPGLYDGAACVKAWVAYHEQGKVAGGAAGVKLRDLQAVARIREARASALERRYVDRDELFELAMRAGVALGTEFDGVAGRIAEQVASLTGGDRARIQALLFEEHRRLRAALTGSLEKLCQPSLP